MSKGKILIVEDEKNIVEVVKYSLEKEGFSTIVANRGDRGLEEAKEVKSRSYYFGSYASGN